MKRAAALLTALLLLLTAFPVFPVYGKNEAGVEFYAGDDIKAGKAFDIYVDLSDKDGLGAYKLSLSYDPDKLQFKYCSFSDKTKNKYMRTTENNGTADILCLFSDKSIKNESLIVRFSPIDENGGTYGFSLSCVCNRPERPEESQKLDMKLTVSERGSTHSVTRSEISTAEKTDESKTSRSSGEASGKNSRTEKKRSKSASPEDSSQPETAEVSGDDAVKEESKEVLTEYSVKKKDTGSDSYPLETTVVFAALAGIIVFAGVKIALEIKKKKRKV